MFKNGFAKNTLKRSNQIAMLDFPTDEVESFSSSSNESTWSSRFVGEIRFPVRELNDAVPRLIGLVLRPRSVRLIPEVISGI